MNVSAVQRWRDQRGVYRPAGEPLDTRRYSVEPLLSDTTPKTFVLQHHYSGSYPAARVRFGLYRKAELVGVAVYSVLYTAQITAAFGAVDPSACLELGRLVLLDEIPANAESWFVSRCHALLRQEGYYGVLSMSDPVPRILSTGVVFPGHIGTVYQALNAHYLGKGTARKLYLFADGRAFSPRAMQKIRAQERGWCSVVDLLIGYGALPPAASDLATHERRCGWLAEAINKCCTPLAHGGNHRYVWLLKRSNHVRYAGMTHPYPKITTQELIR